MTDEQPWSEFEDRPRDPWFLTSDNAGDLRSNYERAECCWDQVRVVAEIPRSRLLSGGRISILQPARFRLCAHHWQILASNDPEATAIEISNG